MSNIKTFPVTNNLIDVFYSEEGYNSKEYVRMFKKDGNWEVNKNSTERARKPEYEFAKVVHLEDVLPDIINYLKANHGNRTPKTSK